MLGPASVIFSVTGPRGRRVFQAESAEQLGQVLRAAYGPDFRLDLAERTSQLQGIARALTENRMADALIGAVYLRLPELSEDSVARLATLAKYSLNQLRVPKGNPDGGQWTREGGAAASANPLLTPASARTRVADLERDREFPFRRLTPGEIEMARSVFGNCIDYDKPKIYDHARLGQAEDEIDTPDGNMYVPKTSSAYREDYSQAEPASKAHFIHEMTHVLQNQHHVEVKWRAAQDWAAGLGYKYRLQPGKRFEDYGIEQQGDIVADYFRMMFLQRQPGSNLDYRDDNSPDNERYLQAYKALLNVDSNDVIHVYGC